MPALNERISAALARVVNERTGRDLVSGEQVRDVAVTREGRVRFSVLLGPQDAAELVREARRAVEGIEGVADVQVDVRDASAPAPPPPKQRTLPVMDASPPQSRQAGVPAHTPVDYPNLGRIIAVSSGKGGVGKSTVASNVAVALAAGGAKVGLMDADIYGPNIPRMMGRDEQPPVEGGKIIPLEAHGVKLMSIGFLVERDQPAIWRGPIIMKIVIQFLRDVAWGELDWLIVDLPPGTGDAQLSLVQATHVRGVLIVTTPQQVAIGDALRGAKMFERVNIPVLGVVENMSWLECQHCGKPTAIFGSGGGRQLANELGLPLLAEVPMDVRVYEGGDTGRPIVTAFPDSGAARALTGLARRVAELVPERATGRG